MKYSILLLLAAIVIGAVFFLGVPGGEFGMAIALCLALTALAFKLVDRPIGILIFSGVIIAVAVFLGVHFRNELFGCFLYTLTCLFYCFPITLILGLTALGFKCAKRPIEKILSYGLLVSFSCLVSIIAFDATGSVINRWKVGSVEAYVARAVPVLDKIKQEKGAYPSELPTNVLGQPPEFLRLYGDYKATGSDFLFEYIDEPAGWAGGAGFQVFDSSSRKWRDEDEGR